VGEYQQTIDWLCSLDALRGMDFRLERLHAALGALGNPERGLAAIQVAGTNGKGSTAAMIHSVYSEAGYRCGLFTSPAEFQGAHQGGGRFHR
jgi:dihydrofolate synthase/folylpolyglutamate synthase